MAPPGSSPAEAPSPDATGIPGGGPRAMPATGRTTTGDGVDIAYYDFGGSGAPLLLVHATGFCAAVLAPLAVALSSRYHGIGLDQRAHGASGRPADGDLDWHGFATDVLAVVDHLGLERPVGFGHSCGGAALLLAEEARPGTFAALWCYEPIVYPGDVPLTATTDANPLSAAASRRRETFASPSEALANFSGKPPLDRLRPDVLGAYVDNGFGPAPGGIRLRCRRDDEAQIYAHGLAHDAFAHLARVRCPVTLACGAETDAVGPDLLAPLARRLPASRTVVLPGLGHFGPLEDPDGVAGSLGAATIDHGDTPRA